MPFQEYIANNENTGTECNANIKHIHTMSLGQ